MPTRLPLYYISTPAGFFIAASIFKFKEAFSKILLKKTNTVKNPIAFSHRNQLARFSPSRYTRFAIHTSEEETKK
jgi:hypothetical protein